MPNEKHLAELKQGVRHWNSWRKNHPREAIDLSGADLSDRNLSNANFQDADLRGAFLLNANLSDATMTGAKLGNANLNKVILSGAIGMTKKQFKHAKQQIDWIIFPDGTEHRHSLAGTKPKYLKPRPRANKKADEPAAAEAAHATHELPEPHRVLSRNGTKLNGKPASADLLAQAVPVVKVEIQESPPSRPVTIAPKPRKELKPLYGTSVTPGMFGSTSAIIGGGIEEKNGKRGPSR